MTRNIDLTKVILDDFFPGTTVAFSIILKIDDVAQNITSDTVTVRFKTKIDDPDASSVIEKNADVATLGASGEANFLLTSVETDVTPGEYYIDIEWTLSSGEIHVAYSQKIRIKDRVSDA